MIYKNNKINIFLILVFLFLLVLILSALFLQSKDNGKESSTITEQDKNIENNAEGNNIDDNIKELQDLNKDVVIQANRITPNYVRSVDESDNFLGNKNAPVEMIIYCDFKNELCLDFLDTVSKVREEFAEEVVIVYRHFYVKSQDYSQEASLASECSAEQGKFWEMHDELFNNHINSVASSQYEEIAKKIELNIENFNDCMSTSKYLEKIEAQIQEADNFGVLGTPSTFINGEKIPGSYDFEDFTDSSGREREGVRSIINRYLKTI